MDALSQALDSDTEGTLELVANMVHATDENLRAQAKRLAASLLLQLSRENKADGAGVARLLPSKADFDIDVDDSLEAIIEAKAQGHSPNIEDLRSRAWAKPPLAVCLVIDASGSMNGARLAAASLLASAVCLRAPQEHAVIAFAKNPTFLRRITSSSSNETVIDRVLSLRGHGITGLRDALAAAHAELSRARATRKVVLLMSDCRATDDNDAERVAAQIENLRIIAPYDDHDEAEAFAGRCNAKWAAPESFATIPSVVRELMR